MTRLPRPWPIALCLGVAAAMLGCKKSPPEALSAPIPPLAPPAAPQAKDDKKDGAKADDQTPPPGVDVSKLDDFERKVFFRIVNKEPSVCGAAHSMMVSAKTDKNCRYALYAVRYVARLVKQGYTDSEVTEYLQKRYRNGKPKIIDVGEAPNKGASAPRVTIVEFADYECPHCKRLQPVLRQLLDEYHNDVRVYFKNYPLAQHENALRAAEAAVAANRQGKFWAYDDKLWANQESLTPADLEKYAKEVGLDVAKWRADMGDQAVKDRVQADRQDGQRLDLVATPTIYINGREFTDARDIESLRDWIDEELGR